MLTPSVDFRLLVTPGFRVVVPMFWGVFSTLVRVVSEALFLYLFDPSTHFLSSRQHRETNNRPHSHSHLQTITLLPLTSRVGTPLLEGIKILQRSVKYCLAELKHNQEQYLKSLL